MHDFMKNSKINNYSILLRVNDKCLRLISSQAEEMKLVKMLYTPRPTTSATCCLCDPRLQQHNQVTRSYISTIFVWDPYEKKKERKIKIKKEKKRFLKDCLMENPKINNETGKLMSYLKKTSILRVIESVYSVYYIKPIMVLVRKLRSFALNQTI